jgi:hypothetical protein
MVKSLGILLFSLVLISCQVDEDDNYYSYSPSNPPTVYSELFEGVWCNKNDCFSIDGNKFFCDMKDDCDETVIIEFQQKYFRLEKQVCGMGPVVAFSFVPPYKQISLLVSGKFVTFYKR